MKLVLFSFLLACCSEPPGQSENSTALPPTRHGLPKQSHRTDEKESKTSEQNYGGPSIVLLAGLNRGWEPHRSFRSLLLFMDYEKSPHRADRSGQARRGGNAAELRPRTQLY